MRGEWIGSALLAVALAALAVLMHARSYLAPLENAFGDSRARILNHETPSDIVVVGIDARSIAALDHWPWARQRHAEFLAQLRAAAPKRVFVDIDFSSRSNAVDDELLQTELTRWQPGTLALPVFLQASSGGDETPVARQPMPGLAESASLATVNQLLSQDGLVRAFNDSLTVEGQRYPSAAAFIAGWQQQSNRKHWIDYSIDPASFRFLSYVDVLSGDFDASQLSGKTIVVGAMAFELNDKVAVPVRQSLTGPVVLSLAAQTLTDGVLQMVPNPVLVTAIVLWAVFCVTVFALGTWRRNAGVLIGSIALLAALSLYAYAAHRLILVIAPFTLVTIAAFAATALQSLDRESVRALMLTLGIRRRDALMNSVVQSSSDCILCIDGSGRIHSANLAAAKLFDCDRDALIDQPASRFMSIFERDDAIFSLLSKLSECEAQSAAGRQVPVELSLCRVDIVDEDLYTLIARDISDRKAQESKLEYQARHDALTGLPNRAALNDYLDRALSGAAAGQPVVLMMLDLCRFKEVNDTLGHNVGDSVLREVAGRFRSSVGERGFLARIGGDEFTVVIDDQQEAALVDSLATALNTVMRAPIRANGIALDVGVSIGVATYPEHANDAQSLLKHADVAMYVAKRRGTYCEYYDPKHDEHTVRRLSMIGELRNAIENKGLELFYQPQINLRNDRVESAEALLRWQHPALGFVSPAEFIAVAESTDLVQPLTEWTLKQALGQIQAWQRRGLDLRVAVNLSARMLQDVTFPQQLRNLLLASAIMPSRLELEITESAMMLDPSRALRVVNEVHDMGVIVSVDDYGTGFSSLGYLRDLPLHALKLDKSFVMQAHERPDDRIIVESTVQLGHALKLQVVAEGVESAWHARFLAEMGYDFAQGYYFARALPAEDFYAWTRTFNGSVDRPAQQYSAPLLTPIATQAEQS
jgi:diguanylate cyclase (GGDEF)-like protein/PAS domain S-box-containing protein